MTNDRSYRLPPDEAVLRADQGLPYRRDYGPKGCAGIVLAPVVLVALLLRGGRR